MLSGTTEKLRQASRNVPDLDDVRAEMARLRKQVEKASHTAVVRGRSQVGDARDDASERLTGLLRESEVLLASAGRELGRFEERAAATVRDRPFQSVGVALVIGFLLSLLFRR